MYARQGPLDVDAAQPVRGEDHDGLDRPGPSTPRAQGEARRTTVRMPYLHSGRHAREMRHDDTVPPVLRPRQDEALMGTRRARSRFTAVRTTFSARKPRGWEASFEPAGNDDA